MACSELKPSATTFVVDTDLARFSSNLMVSMVLLEPFNPLLGVRSSPLPKCLCGVQSSSPSGVVTMPWQPLSSSPSTRFSSEARILKD